LCGIKTTEGVIFGKKTMRGFLGSQIFAVLLDILLRLFIFVGL